MKALKFIALVIMPGGFLILGLIALGTILNIVKGK
jgi:hypothetical protein